MLFGLGAGDDAGVYVLREDLAIVQTVDFFTPIVDDPYEFGAIAAANALSDCFVLGAKPVTGLNIVAFPKSLGFPVLAEILRGGAEKMHEAGGVIVGGHTVQDTEPKYGIAVTGTVDPRRMVTNGRARPGDALLLTKPIGTGIIANLWKNRLRKEPSPENPTVPESVYRKAVESMMTLNRTPSELMVQFGATAATDITGFGLLGHARNIAVASGVELRLEFDRIPRFELTLENAVVGTKGGGDRNKEWIRSSVELEGSAGEAELALLCDPQTSGPLLIAVPEDRAEPLRRAMEERGVPAPSIVGTVTAGGEAGRVVVKK